MYEQTAYRRSTAEDYRFKFNLIIKATDLSKSYAGLVCDRS